MRAKRAKQYRKLMHQYQLNFSFRPPFQTLLDADMVKDAARFKMKLGSMLGSTLHGEIKPMITQCCIRHLYDAEDDGSGAKAGWIEVAKQAERRRCGHHELVKPLSALECIQSVVDPKGSGTNKHRYVVASQDQDVRVRMRSIAGVPLVYINRSVMILEPMAARTQEVREADEKVKIRAGLKGRRPASTGVKRKRENDEEADAAIGSGIDDAVAAGGTPVSGVEPPAKKRKSKGAKAPNPLSVKKPKKDAQKAVARQAEDERSGLRKAAKKDPQAVERNTGVDFSTKRAGSVATEDSRKRKRKRKPKDHAAGSEAVAATEDTE